ncbi:MAG: hypothetical protein V3T62_07800, partial [Alphaproteobacteria bacterium]
MKAWSETLEPTDFTATYKISRLLYDERSEHQHLIVFENAVMGRVLALDGVVQTTEKDEFSYHEMIVHVPILAHGKARRILIIVDSTDPIGPGIALFGSDFYAGCRRRLAPGGVLVTQNGVP